MNKNGITPSRALAVVPIMFLLTVAPLQASDVLYARAIGDYTPPPASATQPTFGEARNSFELPGLGSDKQPVQTGSDNSSIAKILIGIAVTTAVLALANKGGGDGGQTASSGGGGGEEERDSGRPAPAPLPVPVPTGK